MGKTRILIVDDDEVFLEEISDILTTGGYDTRGVSRTDDIPKILEKFLPEVILLDINMSDNGSNIAEILRADVDTAGIPIVIMSGNITDEHRAHFGGEMGIEFFLEKPINPLDIIAAVESNLERE